MDHSRLRLSAWLAVVVLLIDPLSTAAQEGGSPETILQGIDPGLGINSLLNASEGEDAATEAFTSLATKMRVDPQFGSTTSSIPIKLPLGRKEMTPDLTVRYSSNLGNGMLGAGWDLDLGSIKRSTNHGVPLNYAAERRPILTASASA
jgi:hypothetical protein